MPIVKYKQTFYNINILILQKRFQEDTGGRLYEEKRAGRAENRKSRL